MYKHKYLAMNPVPPMLPSSVVPFRRRKKPTIPSRRPPKKLIDTAISGTVGAVAGAVSAIVGGNHSTVAIVSAGVTAGCAAVTSTDNTLTIHDVDSNTHIENLEKNNAELITRIEDLEEKNRELTKEKESLKCDISYQSRRLKEKDQTIKDYERSRIRFKFPKTSIPGEDHVLSYNSKPYKTIVPLDVSYDSLYTLEVTYSPLKSFEFDDEHEKVIIVNELYHRDYTFYILIEYNENKNSFYTRFKEIEQDIFGIANIINTIDRVLHYLDNYYCNLNRKKEKLIFT